MLAKFEAHKAHASMRAQYDHALRWKATVLGASFKAMQALSGSKDELMLLFKFFLEHPPKESVFTLDDLGNLLDTLDEKWVLEKSKEIVKKHLDLSPAALLQLKDETFVTDRGLKRWLQVLEGLTSTFNEVLKERKKLNKECEEVLRPTKTPNGMAVDLNVMRDLLKLAYPATLGAPQDSWGINVDSTELAEKQVTAASIRPLHNELALEGISTNSADHTYTFSLYFGPDTREFLQENVLRQDVDGTFPAILSARSLFFIPDSFSHPRLTSLSLQDP